MMNDVAGPGLLEMLRVAAALALVLGLVFVARWLLRRREAPGAVCGLAVAERLTLARNVQLVLVTAHGRRLLLGVAEKGVELVADLGDPEPEAADNVSAEASAASAAAAGRPLDFALWLARRLRNGKAGR